MTDDITRTKLARRDALVEDRVAIVTGGDAGIGRGIAIGLAEFGADVAIFDIDAEVGERVAALVREKGRRALPIACDVMDRDAVRAATDRVVSELGGVDILVNNAGGTRSIPILEMTDRQADRQIDLNLKALVAVTQAGAKAMIAGGRGGVIVNVASIEGLRAAPGYAVYAACKAGMANFTRSAALELADHGIRVNAIAPDFVATEFMARMMPGILDEEARARHARTIPLGRAGDYDDCAGAAVFLCSALSAYVTGVTISVDGGTWASGGWTRRDGGGWKLFA